MKHKRSKKGDVIRAYQRQGLVDNEHRNSPFTVIKDMESYVETQGCILTKTAWRMEKEKNSKKC